MSLVLALSISWPWIWPWSDVIGLKHKVLENITAHMLKHKQQKQSYLTAYK